jgi:gas vesicle protein
MSDRDNSTLIALLTGMAIGGAVALLLAPHSGKQTRELLKKRWEDTEENLTEIAQKAKQHWRDGLQQGQLMMEKGHQLYEHSRQKMQEALDQGHEVMDQGIEEFEKRKQQIAAAIESGRKAMESARKES